MSNTLKTSSNTSVPKHALEFTYLGAFSSFKCYNRVYEIDLEGAHRERRER